MYTCEWCYKFGMLCGGKEDSETPMDCYRNEAVSPPTEALETVTGRVQEASKIGSIRCHADQCKKCSTAANETLLTGLKEIRVRLESENERGAISDTLWYSDHETLFDFMDSLIEANK